MTERGIVMGFRGSGDCGLFVAPLGVDAYVASDDQLTLNVSSKVSQLILSGWVYEPSIVAMGLTRSPYVFITSRETVSDIVGLSGWNGVIRPSPSGLKTGTEQGGGITFITYPPSYAAINGNGATMTIQTTRATFYSVYNKPFT
ncbi:hypothetical protein DYI24_01135 [Rhodopseudomonas sp. BR0C11]|uniref:hypothetical protein n=1 Tax=Rhodopseudomonas sp. BR0C11 TaxID=2269370 RepID=UPI0013E0209E|nr:hypothetical protein [Rhodopseudomonas sp. BR0C11]NEV75649.1 hypothetical protein [Rhodopseudomonas sp. BR0C11]